MEKRVIWLVIIVLLLSAVPVALVFDSSITGKIGANIAGACPCTAPDGTIIDTCYAGGNPDYASLYCSHEYNDATGETYCKLSSACNKCGCGSFDKGCYFSDPAQNYFCANKPVMNPSSCADGTLINSCSITKPLYCSNNILSQQCNICGCTAGYICNADGRCLIDNLVETKNQTNKNNSALIIWRGVNVLGNQTNFTLTARQQQILLSGKRISSEVVDTKQLGDKIGVSHDTLVQTESKINQNKKALQALYLTNEISGDLTKAVLDKASQPLLSPKECVGFAGESCVGLSECCDNLICNYGVCVSNLNVGTKNLSLVLNQQIVVSEKAVSNLVEVKAPVNAKLQAVKYDTHPNYVKENVIPYSVNLGFYEIKVDKETDAELSFEVNNDVLILNQVSSVALYRLVGDQWQQLDLLDIKYGDEKTVFTFRTEGFSYFEIIGNKDIPSTLTVSSSTPLWALYEKSIEPGVSIVELSFVNEDKLTFGKLSGVPFIDLGFKGF